MFRTLDKGFSRTRVGILCHTTAFISSYSYFLFVCLFVYTLKETCGEHENADPEPVSVHNSADFNPNPKHGTFQCVTVEVQHTVFHLNKRRSALKGLNIFWRRRKKEGRGER